MCTTSRYQTQPEIITALIATYDEHAKMEEKAITCAQMCVTYLPTMQEGEHFDDATVSRMHLLFLGTVACNCQGIPVIFLRRRLYNGLIVLTHRDA